jgi:hypothetical protein
MVSRKSSTLALALLALCVLVSPAAQADGVVPASAQPAQPVAPNSSEGSASVKTTVPSVASPADTAGSKSSDPVAGKAGEPANGAAVDLNAAAKTPAPTDPAALLYAETVAPGPFEAKRKLLLASIKMAKKQGFGITGYLGELSKVEDQIKQGNSGPQLEARIDSIADGLQDQLKRRQVLQTQRPIGTSSSRSSYTQASSESGAGRPRKSTDAILNELRQKYGDKIPSGLGGMDGDLKEKLMKSDAAKEYLRKMGQ